MGSSRQDGSCDTQLPSCQKADALWTPGMLGASLLAFQRQRGMRGKKGTKGEGKYAANLLLTFRVTAEEKARLEQQADMAGLSVSAYLRRRFFGGRPLIAHTDAMMIRELRRIGGLLKHNFETLRQSGAAADMLERQERTLGLLISAIEHLGVPGHDSEESQTGNRR